MFKCNKMANVPLFFLISVFFVYVAADSLQIGNVTNAQLAYVENVKLSGIPLKTRTKNVFYNNENPAPKVIKGITAVDLDKGSAKATITSGGVGSTFVNVKIKGSRGDGLNFQVQIFV